MRSMSLARAWRRQLFGASSAALIVPSAMLAALLVLALGGGFGSIGVLGQLFAGPSLPGIGAPGGGHVVSGRGVRGFTSASLPVIPAVTPVAGPRREVVHQASAVPTVPSASRGTGTAGGAIGGTGGTVRPVTQGTGSSGSGGSGSARRRVRCRRVACRFFAGLGFVSAVAATANESFASPTDARRHRGQGRHVRDPAAAGAGRPGRDPDGSGGRVGGRQPAPADGAAVRSITSLLGALACCAAVAGRMRRQRPGYRRPRRGFLV